MIDFVSFQGFIRGISDGDAARHDGERSRSPDGHWTSWPGNDEVNSSGEFGLAKEIDRKLRLTAALLGTTARKELAAAFRRVNPNTTFDVTRADKWLQGRALPRERQVYDDWSRVLGLDRPGQWVSDSDFEDFLAEACARHGRDPGDMQDRMDALAGGPAREGPGLSLAGTYVVYSHAWSPYFRGQFVRGELSVAAPGRLRAGRLQASYAETLPTGRMQLDGEMAVDSRTVRIEVSDATRISQWLTFSLFPPSPPGSVLGGLMSGTTLIGPDAEPSTTRTVLIRLRAAAPLLRSAEAYLPAGASIAADLAALGVPVDAPEAVDCGLARFMAGDARAGVDQVSGAVYRPLVELFDRLWLRRGPGAALANRRSSGPGEAGSLPGRSPGRARR